MLGLIEVHIQVIQSFVVAPCRGPPFHRRPGHTTSNRSPVMDTGDMRLTVAATNGPKSTTTMLWTMIPTRCDSN